MTADRYCAYCRDTRECPDCEGTCQHCIDRDTPASVAQDAPDATESPARTPGESGTAEARTEAHVLNEYGTTDCPIGRVRANADDEGGVLVCSACGAEVERESATDPGTDVVDLDAESERVMREMTTELVALRAEVERLTAITKAQGQNVSWMSYHDAMQRGDALQRRALAAEAALSVRDAQVARVEALADGWDAGGDANEDIDPRSARIYRRSARAVRAALAEPAPEATEGGA